MAEEKPDLTEGGKKPELRQERRAEDATNRRRDGMFAACFLAVLGLVYIVVYAPNIGEYGQGVITLVLGAFVGYLTAMINFEFGTTRASASKDATITGMAQVAAVTADTAKTAQAASDKAIGLAMVASPETTVAGLKAAAVAAEPPVVTPAPPLANGVVPAAAVAEPDGKG